MASVAKLFMERFRGLMRAHGTYRLGKADASGKVQGQAKTLKAPITVKKWDEHLSGSIGIGVVPIGDDSSCHFGAIDVDVYDLNLENLERRIIEAELPLVVCRTKSGGAHLYLFVSEPTKASLIREKLMEWAVLVGYPNVEVFPKQSQLASEDDVGSWINMPYFGKRTTRYAIREGKALTTREFLDYADTMALTSKALSNIQGKQDKALEGAPPCLQHLARAGFPEGTRNQALYNLGVFCKLKFGDEWLDKAKELNKKYVVPPLSDKEATTTLKQLEKKTYFYKCKEPPIVTACSKSLCSKREFGISRSSDDPGIVLDGLQKILTNPPMWMLNVNGKRIQLDSSEELLSQKQFTLSCIDTHNIVPNRIKENAWREIIKGLMERVEEIEAPEDAGPLGQFMFLLEKFCTERSTTDGVEEIMLEKVFIKEGRMYFQSPHLMMFMDRHRYRVTSKQAWVFLREVGGEKHRLRVKGKIIRTWSVPEFASVDIDFSTPKAVDEEGDDLF